MLRKSPLRRKAAMKQNRCLIAMIVFLAIAPAAWSYAHADDQADIKALEQRFADAFKAKDVVRIMSVYVPNETLIVSMSCRRASTSAGTRTRRTGKTSSRS